MAWAVELPEEADRELGKLDPQHRRRVLKFLHQRLAQLDNPRSIGQALQFALGAQHDRLRNRLQRLRRDREQRHHAALQVIVDVAV